MTMTVKHKLPKLDPEKLAVGDIVLVSSWARIINVVPPLHADEGEELEIQLENLYDRNQRFTITGEDVISRIKCATYYKDELYLSQTEILELMEQSKGDPIAVKFTTKDGESRTLIGSFGYIDRFRGYSKCLDLELEDGPGWRSVDNRTVEWLIWGGTRFVGK